MKQRFILTEKDLHRIIKECINEALNEVSLGGESLHGNNAADWLAMSNIRGYKSNYSNDGKVAKHSKQQNRDVDNFSSVAKDMEEKGMYNPEDANGSMAKARRMVHNMERNPIKKLLKMSEDFNHWKSPKLANIVKQHGISKYNDSGTNYLITQITDDDIVGNDVTDNPSSDRYIDLGDGSKVDLSNSTGNEVANDYFGNSSGYYTNKYIPKMRHNNGFAKARANKDVSVDYFSRKEYQPMTTRGESAKFLRTNPYFMRDKNKLNNKDSGFNQKETNRIMKDLKSGNDMYGKPNREIK